MEDRETIREVWEGRLPVCFSLAHEDIYTMEQPEPFYLMVPRQSYFPLVTDKVQRHFTKFIEKQSEMWLDFDGQPLKWHYPIGVLFDLLVSDTALPWNITVHFKDFPTDDLLFCHSKEVVEAHYMSGVKEADCLKHRSTVIHNMQRKDHKQLWAGLLHDKFDQFWSINRKLMEMSGDLAFRSIPFRIYKPDKSTFIQNLYRPLGENGYQKSLGDLLKAILPEDFSHNNDSQPRVVIQGITVAMDTPLIWLSVHLSHPDNFLHVCVLENGAATSSVN